MCGGLQNSKYSLKSKDHRKENTDIDRSRLTDRYFYELLKWMIYSERFVMGAH